MHYLLVLSLLTTPALAQSTPAETRSLSRTVITTTNSPAAYTDRTAILNLLKDRLKATNDHNADRLTACFTTDATVIVNGELKRTLTIYIDGLTATTTSANTDSGNSTGKTETISNQQIIRLRIENSFAFVTETYEETPAPGTKAERGPTEPRPAVVLEVLRKGEDGRWRITHFHVSTRK